MTAWTPELIAKLKDCCLAGKTKREAATHMELSYDSLNRATERYKVGPWPSDRGGRIRSAPGDIADHWSNMSLEDLAARYDCCVELVRKWGRSLGLSRTAAPREFIKRPGTRRPVPDDFRQFAAREGADLLKARYRSSYAVIKRWEAEDGITLFTNRAGPELTKRPDDFAEVQAGKTQAVLGEHYGVSRDVVSRWLREIGVKRERFVSPTAPKPVARPVPIKLHAFSLQPINRPTRDGSPAGMAADFLRRLGPVFRCTATGRADPKGTHWRRGSAVLTDDEVIERAVRNGWQPDAWKRIAA